MPSFAHLTAVLALTGTALSTPVQFGKRSGFTIQQVENEKVLRNGPAQIVKTLRKYGMPVPLELLDAAAARTQVAASSGQNGSETATPSDQYDSSYLCPVTVGSSQVQLDFDTGSADLWVFSSLQSASERGDHHYYTVDPSNALDGYTWNITYGDGSGASGNVYNDSVTVAGITYGSQAVEAATEVSAQFTQDKSTDGLLGLAFSSINTVQPQAQNTFFDNVKGSLPQPLFAVDLKYHSAGTYDFGFIDSSKYTGEITYVEVDNSQGFWGFSATGYSVGSGSTKSASISGIFDTGTTLIYADDSIVSAYYKQVKGASSNSSAGGYTFPCSASTPDFSITVGGVKQTVPGKYVNYSPVDEGSSTCFGGIQSNSGLQGLSIFGDIFLKSKYVIHENDGTTPRIGLGQQPSE